MCMYAFIKALEIYQWPAITNTLIETDSINNIEVTLLEKLCMTNCGSQPSAVIMVEKT